MIRTLLLLLSLISTLSFAVDIKTLNPVETIEITPEGFQSPIKYNITLPQNYANDTDKRYFVLFDMHPRSQPFISGMHDWLSHNGEWPWLKTILITPADYNPEFADTFNQLVANPKNQRMLDILEQGILKTVDDKYRTNGYRIFSGFMGNAAFGLYSFLNRPSLFDAYLIASPTLQNNFANVLTDAPEKLKTKYDDMKFLYMTIGDHNYEKAHIEPYKQFERELQKLNSDKLKWISNSDENHYYMSRPIVTLLNGIEALFDDIHHDLSADSEISKQGVDAIIAYYHKLSKQKYGFEISAEGSLKALAKSLIVDNPNKAIDIYVKTTELYPQSAYAYASLARAYSELGNIERAITVQSIAVEKSKSMVEWHQNRHSQFLEEFKQKLKNKTN